MFDIFVHSSIVAVRLTLPALQSFVESIDN